MKTIASWFTFLALLFGSVPTMANELAVHLDIADGEVDEFSPVFAQVTVTNRNSEDVVLSQVLGIDAGTLIFEARAPGGDRFNIIAPVAPSVLIGSSRGDVIPANSHAVFFGTLLPISRLTLWSTGGTWHLRARVVGMRGITCQSTPVPIVVRPMDSEPHRTRTLKVNDRIFQAILSNPSPQVSSTNELLQLRPEGGEGSEIRQTIDWLAAVSKVAESEPDNRERDYLSARKVQEKLPKTVQQIMALKLAWVLFKVGNDELANEQLSIVDKNSRQRRQLEYEVSERRREGQWPTPAKAAPR